MPVIKKKERRRVNMRIRATEEGWKGGRDGRRSGGRDVPVAVAL
jgi:hypothetical protein